MKKADLKKLIKPIVKECIHEVLLEEGLLSNVVSEVAKGLQPQNMVVESREPRVQSPPPRPKTNTTGHRKKLLEAIGRDAYNGVDLFEGTDPAAPHREQSAGTVDLGDPKDSGVDISSIMGGASKMWEAMK